MASETGTIGLYYDGDGNVEPTQGPRKGDRPAKADRPPGPMGRRVAGQAFLDAFFQFGSWSKLVALVPNEASAKSIQGYCEALPKPQREFRSVDVLDVASFRERFLTRPPVSVLHFPIPLVPTFAWARQRGGPSSFSMTGLTHTLASLNGLSTLNALITAPFEPHDALICTSEAVTRMVRTVTGICCDSLRDRFGGEPRLLPRLETIPSGVDPESYRPARPDERALIRQTLGIADDEVTALFVGPLSFHSEANPYPMYRALARAARESGRRVHLLLAGWAPNEAIRRAFHDGARVFGPNLRVTIVDGTKPEYRRAAWDAADLFTSLSDSIHETSGRSIAEAMACGLPVVASDWDGHRDRVVDGETGYLVPTAVVRDSIPDAALRLLLGEVNYDHFLSECSQAVVVDEAAAADAYTRLIADDELRRRLGLAGRRRAIERFSWSVVIDAFERLWQSLDEERLAGSGRAEAPPDRRTTPACYPPVETSFAGYPTEFLDDDRLVVADEDAAERLDWLLKLPLTNYASGRRSAETEAIRAALRAATPSCSIGQLDEALGRAGVLPPKRRPTIAWMLKYALLSSSTARPAPEPEGEPVATASAAES